ncbi:MAG: ABC transporter permease [Planctomycetia bacterium]|nr:ABC transporter permease [Planctomycetia bacterium]
MIKMILRKELKELAPIAFSIWIGGILVYLLIRSVAKPSSPDSIFSIPDPLSYSLLLLMIYTFFASALSFVHELEDGTYLFLRRLPISNRMIAYGKILAILIGFVFMSIVISGTMFLLSVVCDYRITGNPQVAFARYGIGIAEAFCWGLFFSSRCKNQYKAILGTILCILLYDGIIQDNTIHLLKIDRQYFGNVEQMIIHPAVLTAKLGFLLFLLPGLFGTCRWFSHMERIPRKIFDLRIGKNRKEIVRERRAAPEFWGLFWLMIRQERFFLFAVFCIYLLFIFPALSAMNATRSIQCAVYYSTFIPCAGVGIFFLSEIFYKDIQTRSGAMLVHAAASPFKLWTSRILLFGPIWILMLIPFSLIFAALECSNPWIYNGGIGLFELLQTVRVKDFFLPTLYDAVFDKTCFVHLVILYFFGGIMLFAIAASFSSWFRSRILSIGGTLFVGSALFIFHAILFASLNTELIPVAYVMYLVILLLISFLNIRQRIRKGSLLNGNRRLTGLLFIPPILLFIFGPQISLIFSPLENGAPVPDPAIVKIPFDLKSGMDQETAARERDLSIAVHHQLPYQFYEIELGQPFCFVRMETREEIEKCWNQYLALYKETKTGFFAWSPSLESALYDAILDHSERWTAEDWTKTIDLLNRIPGERPSVDEQGDRLLLRLTRLASRKDHAWVPYWGGEGIFTADPVKSKIYCRWLQNYFLFRLQGLKNEMEYAYTDPVREKDLPITIYESQCLWRSAIGRRFENWGVDRFEGKIWLTEMKRRTAILQLAVFGYYQKHEKYPEDLNLLVKEGFLKELPKTSGKKNPFRISRRLPGPQTITQAVPGKNQDRTFTAYYDFQRTGKDLLPRVSNKDWIFRDNQSKTERPVICDNDTNFGYMLKPPKKNEK